MQLQAEASQLEREAIERQYRLEIDTLKNKLARSGYSAGALSDDQIREMGEGSARQQREMSDQRRTIAQLELEIARLKDEATLQALRHREESKYAAEKQAQELADLERRKDEEVVSVERRHADTVTALKRIHTEELAALRERSKDGAALDQLAGQLKSASGSIKLLEEQLVSKYRGLDAAKDGQMEARERLLAEMEEKARLRAETAEAEGYRLKGLLMHMEHVATSLRSQGSEEKERLRQEHQRLHSMQLAIEAERHSMQARLSEELALLKTRMGEADGEMQKLSHEKRQYAEAVAAAQRALDTDRAEFAAYLSSHSRTAEATAERLAEEEARLSRVREELSRERTLLEQRKAAFLIRNIPQLMMLHTLVKCRSLTFAKRYEPPHHHATLRASASAPPLHDETSCNARDLCATTVYYPAHDVGSAASGDAHDQSWRTLATHGRAPAGDGGDPAGVGRRCATAVAAAGGARLRSDV
jgi:hypothetical protein